MATDSTHLQSGDTGIDAGSDMGLGGSALGSVQLAAATDTVTEIKLPQGEGRQVIVVPANPGQTIELPTDSPDGLLAKLGADGNLAIVVDGRTIILKGYAAANEAEPVKIVTNDGDPVDVTDLLAGTLPDLDIQTAAGPAAGPQVETVQGSGIFIAFAAGPVLPGLLAEGVLDPTALGYKLVDDDRRQFVEDEEDREDKGPSGVTIESRSVNEDDLLGTRSTERYGENEGAAPWLIKTFGDSGNDPFDGKDIDGGNDGAPDQDREPLIVTANLTMNFGANVPGKLLLDASLLPAGLTSEGEPIVYEVVPGGGGSGPLIAGKAGDRVIFTVQVAEENSNGTFHLTFRLFDNFDNATPASLLGANEQDLALLFKIIAEDSNGTQLSGVWNVGVRDDIPFFGEVVQDGGLIIVPSPDSFVLDETLGGDLDADDKEGAPWNGEAVLIINSYLPQFIAMSAEAASKAGITLDPAVLAKFEAMADQAANTGGIAVKQLVVSFGADGPSQEFLKSLDEPAARDSVYGGLSGSGENERPFELFMVQSGTAGIPADGDATVADQATNATAIWEGVEYPVHLAQFNAALIFGYIELGGDATGHMLPAFILSITDNGQVSLIQILPIGHAIDGSTPEAHDDGFTILGADGITPLVYVRATDYDGDHAILPLTIGFQDDGPVYLSTDYAAESDDPEDVVGDGLISEGNIRFNFGVDGAGSLAIGSLIVTNGADEFIDLKDLRTADGHQITIADSVGAASGVITWEGVVADGPNAGDKVFTFTLDGSGDNIGDFAFTLHSALENPFTNDGSDNLSFQFGVVATDSDGDTTEGSVEIDVEAESQPVPTFNARFALVADETGGDIYDLNSVYPKEERVIVNDEEIVDMRDAKISHIESILLTDENAAPAGARTKLILNASDVLDFTDNGEDADTLYIIGSKGDSLELHLDGGVTIESTTPINDPARGATFTQYNFSNGGHLTVDTDVTVTTA